MKKFVFALAAIVSVVVFSAFAFDNSPKTTDTEYYFYEVVGGLVNTEDPIFDEPMTLEEFALENPVSCAVGDNADCIRAWETGHTPTTSGPGDEVIRKL